MEKLNNIVKSVSSALFSRGDSRRNPSRAWKAILGVLCISTLGALIESYVVYLDVLRPPEINAQAQIERPTPKIGDVASILEIYRAKERTLSGLIAEPPRFLSPTKGSQSSSPSAQNQRPEASTSTPETLR